MTKCDQEFWIGSCQESAVYFIKLKDKVFARCKKHYDYETYRILNHITINESEYIIQRVLES